MRMDNSNLKYFREQFSRQVKELENMFGVKIDLGNISYNNAGFTSKITVKNRDSSGINGLAIDPREESAISMRFQMSGLIQPGQKVIGECFNTMSGMKVMITGYKSRNSKYPITYLGEDGKNYKGSIWNFVKR